MKTINLDSHNFDKTNLVGDKKHRDHYKCTICGCKGMRTGFVDYIEVTEAEYKKSLKCTYIKPEKKVNRPKFVTTGNMAYIGIAAGRHEVVECPKKDLKKYAKDVWIFSNQRNEAVRLLDHEYTNAEF